MKKLLTILMLCFSIAVSAQDKGGLPVPSSGNVTLPLDEYNKLTELASKPEKKTEISPIPFAIKRANLKLRVASESISGTVQCDGEIFTKGVHKIPLMSTPAVLDARQANQTLPLMQEGGMHTAILSGPGEFSITLDAGIPLNIESGRASFSLPVPMAGSAQLSLEIQGEHTNVRINPGLITRRSTDNGKTTVEAALVPGQPATVWWTTREIIAPAAPREVRFLSDVKTLASISESDIRLAVLANITVIQGEPAQFEVDLPPEFEMTGVTGATLESEELQSGHLVLKTNGTEKRNHQFLISLEKPISAAKADVPFLGFKGTQRETGEVLVEGDGTIELTATEGGTLKRMDLKEVNAYLRSLARHSLHAAFRYHRQPSEPPSLALAWNRYPDSSVLAAGVELADITTLVTSEGRSLTEVKLAVKNQAKPFLKVGLPPGASIVTADVAGEPVKPVQGSDGIRVPLLRPGFRPSGAYKVTFVIMHAGTPFDKKGNSVLILPKMDVPISILKWEIFLPERYRVKDFGGDAIAASRLPAGMSLPVMYIPPPSAVASNLPNANTQTPRGTGTPAIAAIRDGINVNEVRWDSGISTPSRVNAEMVQEIKVILSPADAEYGRGAGQVQITTKQGGNAHNFSVSSNATSGMGGMGAMDNMNTFGGNGMPAPWMAPPDFLGRGIGQVQERKAGPSNEVSANVVNLQRRVAGVLPIRVDVPRTGSSYSFVKTLLLDEETKVTFNYKSK